MRLLLLALALAATLWSAPAVAEGYAPLGAAPQADETPPAAPETRREPGAWAAVGGWLIRFNRTVNREVQRHMSALRDGTSAGAFLLALLAAFGYGALHVAGPGHGKVVVASYFLSREVPLRRGLLMGGRIAVVHVIAAVVVVGLADLVLRMTLGTAPGEIPGVRLASYGLIATIGAVMLVQAVRRSLGHAPAHRHGPGCGHAHQSRQEGLLALGVGVVPCTGAILVMLYAIANDVMLAGLLLVGAISLGMALTLSGIGIASIWARRAVAGGLDGDAAARRPRAAAVMEYAGAALIAALGAALFAGEALGFFRLPGA